MRTVLDEFMQRSLAVAVRITTGVGDAREALYPPPHERGSPEYNRSDNGPEFADGAMPGWLRRVGLMPLRMYLRSPWENGCNELVNGTLRREIFNAEGFTTTEQAQTVINHWF